MAKKQRREERRKAGEEVESSDEEKDSSDDEMEDYSDFDVSEDVENGSENNEDKLFDEEE